MSNSSAAGTADSGSSSSSGNPAGGTPNSKRASTSLSSGFSASVSSLRDATSSSAQNFISDLIATSLPSTSVDGAKASLSLRTTTLQFTRFVHKAGPVFAVQDTIESVFRWQDPLLTLLVGCAWAIICKSRCNDVMWRITACMHACMYACVSPLLSPLSYRLVPASHAIDSKRRASNSLALQSLSTFPA